MSRKKKFIEIAADFETYTNGRADQSYTEVWSAACIRLDEEDAPENVKQFSSLDSFMDYLFSLSGNIKVYFHNEKFDGTFILTYLIKSPKFKLWSYISKDPNTGEEEERLYKENRETKTFMPNGYYTYNISMKGQWYLIQIRDKNRDIEIVDSAKLAPMSLSKLGKDFKTKYQKLEMDYTGERHAGYKPTPKEMTYIKNDVLVLKEVLLTLKSYDLTGLTIGSICLKNYKKTLPGNPRFNYRNEFPDLTKLAFEVPYTRSGWITCDEYIRNSYHGGWCYCMENGREVHAEQLTRSEREEYKQYATIINEKKDLLSFSKNYGMTFDVNSLYPSMMQSESGNVYPHGKPQFSADPIVFDNIKNLKYRFYFVHFYCHFDLKPEKLPMVQIKKSMLYNPKEWLKTSDVVLYDGTIDKNSIELTMAKPEFELFCENYDITDFVFIDFCYFPADDGLFDTYINYWSDIKRKSKGALRTIAKLMLNNLYGKFASSEDSNYKIAYLNDDGALRFKNCIAYDKEPGYIAVGSAITAYARCFTIRAAQENYSMFCYADTDSIHLFGKIQDVKGIKVHPTDFNAWKMETCWDSAIFSRQKTYIEHVTHEDGEPVEDTTDTKKTYEIVFTDENNYKVVEKDEVKRGKPYYNIKCAGMGAQAKKNFNKMLNDGTKTLSDFKPGLVVPGNLKAKLVRGGSLLVEHDYKMRKDIF